MLCNEGGLSWKARLMCHIHDKNVSKKKKPIALDGKNLFFHSKLLKDGLKMHFMFNNSHDITMPSAVHRR